LDAASIATDVAPTNDVREEVAAEAAPTCEDVSRDARAVASDRFVDRRNPNTGKGLSERYRLRLPSALHGTTAAFAPCPAINANAATVVTSARAAWQ
jgi:hypothetical protein